MKLAAAERNRDLYPDRHLNVFVPYVSHGLDYNVTRALITTLRWSRPELTREFLTEVVALESLEGDLAACTWEFDLQGCDYEDFDPAAAKARVVLGISRAGELARRLPSLEDPERNAQLLLALNSPVLPAEKLAWLRTHLNAPDLDMDDVAVLAHTLEELEQGCLPDGWIFSPDGGVCVLVEAKLTKLLDPTQLQRYADVYYGRELADGELALRRWDQVAAFFAARRDHADPRTAFLCAQLVDYLDLLGLGGWDGFKPYDFDLEAFQELLPKFFRFVERVRVAADEQGLPLAEVRPAPTGARVALADPALPGELRFDLRANGIRIEYCVGDAPAGRFPGRMAVDAVLEGARPSSANPLADAELDLETELRVRVERLRSDGELTEFYVDRETLNAPFDPASFGEVLEELRLQHPPLDRARDAVGRTRRALLSIGCTIPRDDAIGSGAALLDKVLPLVRDLSRVARALKAPAVPAEPEPAPQA